MSDQRHQKLKNEFWKTAERLRNFFNPRKEKEKWNEEENSHSLKKK